MIIDVFCHITPPKYVEKLSTMISPAIISEMPHANLHGLIDLDLRFKVMNQFPDMRQVLTLTNPPPENILPHDQAIEMSQRVNDEMAELVQKYPERFLGAVACLPMNDVDAALREFDRAVNQLGMKGFQVFTNIMGRNIDDPEFEPVFAKAVEYDTPVWLHPWFHDIGQVAKSKEDYDNYKVFTGKKDMAWAMHRAAFGLPDASTVAMTRLVYSGIFDRYPNIKIITHHCGSSIPYFFKRIEMHALMFSEKEGSLLNLQKPVQNYYKMFYADVALHGNTEALKCGLNYFGLERLMFGTDAPFGPTDGLWATAETVRSVNELPISSADKEAIFENNARRIIKL